MTMVSEHDIEGVAWNNSNNDGAIVKESREKPTHTRPGIYKNWSGGETRPANSDPRQRWHEAPKRGEGDM